MTLFPVPISNYRKTDFPVVKGEKKLLDRLKFIKIRHAFPKILSSIASAHLMQIKVNPFGSLRPNQINQWKYILLLLSPWWLFTHHFLVNNFHEKFTTSSSLRNHLIPGEQSLIRLSLTE